MADAPPRRRKRATPRARTEQSGSRLRLLSPEHTHRAYPKDIEKTRPRSICESCFLRADKSKSHTKSDHLHSKSRSKSKSKSKSRSKSQSKSKSKSKSKGNLASSNSGPKIN
jgi:hypothetical protein